MTIISQTEAIDSLQQIELQMVQLKQQMELAGMADAARAVEHIYSSCTKKVFAALV